MSYKDADDVADAIAGALEVESRKLCKESPDGVQGHRKNLSTGQLLFVVVFACLGSMTVYIPRTYTSGFYITFLRDSNLDITYGLIALSTITISLAFSPYIARSFPQFRVISITWRCFLLLAGNVFSYFVMSGVDEMVRKDPSGVVAFTVIGVSRAFQGACSGIFFVIVQGEIMDLYLSDRKTLMVVISGCMHIGPIFGITVSAKLYETGGWLLTGLIIPILDIILMSTVPFFGKIHQTVGHGNCTATERGECEPIINDIGSEQTLKDKPNKSQKAAYFIPDVAVFFNNLAFSVLIYSIPPRIEKFNQKSISTSALLSTLLLVFSFLASIALAFATNRKIKTEFAMLIGNIVFYIGAILAFASTTEFLNFPLSYEIGCFLVGIGNAGVTNLAIMSKFSMYERWGLRTDGLAEKSTALFNFSMSASTAVGVVLGGLTITRESEIPAIVGAIAVSLVNTAGFIACILIK